MQTKRTKKAGIVGKYGKCQVSCTFCCYIYPSQSCFLVGAFVYKKNSILGAEHRSEMYYVLADLMCLSY